MLAEALHVQQPSIAKLERRGYVRLDAAHHIEAMGGQLESLRAFRTVPSRSQLR